MYAEKMSSLQTSVLLELLVTERVQLNWKQIYNE